MSVRITLFTCVLYLGPAGAARAAGPLPTKLTPAPSLATHAKTTPIASLPPKEQQALKNAMSKVAVLKPAVQAAHGHLQLLVKQVHLEQARRAAGVNVLTGVR